MICTTQQRGRTSNGTHPQFSFLLMMILILMAMAVPPGSELLHWPVDLADAAHEEDVQDTLTSLARLYERGATRVP